MSRRKTVAPAVAPEGPNPDRGGAFIRLPDGSLVRDESEEQHVPEDEPEVLMAPDAPLQLPPLTQDSEPAPPAPPADTGKEG